MKNMIEKARKYELNLKGWYAVFAMFTIIFVLMQGLWSVLVFFVKFF